MIIVVSVFILADIVLIALLARNISRSKRIKKYGKVKQAEVRGWKAIPGTPPMYAIKICYDYDTEGNEKTKWIIVTGRFAKKYEKEKNIDIVLMPKPNHFYLTENDWKQQNAILSIEIVLLTFTSILAVIVVVA